MKKRPKKRLKICITCSSGGHLVEALKATELIDHNKYFVTFWTDNLREFAEQHKVYCITHPGRNPLRLFKNCVQAFFLLLKEKPNLIISTGADVAVATCILGKLMGKRLIYIESGGQVVTPSISGRLVYPFADLFIVQWKPALKSFSKAVYGGPLF